MDIAAPEKRAGIAREPSNHMKAAASKSKSPAKNTKAKRPPLKCDNERQLARAIALCLETRSFKFLAKLLGELAPTSPASNFWTRVLRLAAEEFEENGPGWDRLRPPEGHGLRRLTALTPKGKKILEAGFRAALHASECRAYTIEAIRKQLNGRRLSRLRYS